MGTASLVLGSGLIVFGLAYWLIMEAVPWPVDILDMFIVSVPSVVIGALFLRKYDRDKKNLEKTQIQNNEPEEEDEPEVKMSKSEWEKTIIVVVGLNIALILTVVLAIVTMDSENS